MHANNQNCTQSNLVKTRDCSLLKLIAIKHKVLKNSFSFQLYLCQEILINLKNCSFVT